MGLRAFFLLLLLGTLSVPAVAAEVVATVTALTGEADVTRAGGPARPLGQGDGVEAADVLRTRSDASLVLSFRDGSRVRMGGGTRLEVARYVSEGEPDSLLKVTRGWVRSFVGELFSERKESFRIQTPTAVMGVQGTDFAVNVRPFSTRVAVYSGVVAVRNVDPLLPRVQILRAFQATEVRAERPPTAPVPVPQTEPVPEPAPAQLGGTGAAGTPTVPPVTLPPRPNLPGQLPNLLNLPNTGGL